MYIIQKIKNLFLRIVFLIVKKANLADAPLSELAIRAGVNIGKNNLIESPFWDAAEPYLITIGNNCQITHNVRIFTHGGGAAVRSVYPQFDCFGKVHIGNFVYIGSNSIIMPGVTIGDNVIVAAGSVVTKSIHSGVVVAGNPARFICSITDYIDRNMKYNLNTKGLSVEEKKKFLEKLDESKFISKDFI